MDRFRKSLALPVFAILRCRHYLRHSGCSGKSISIPLLIIAMGAAWLMNNLEIAPAVNWVWTVNLAAPGILILAFGRWNRINFVTGAFLAIASVVSLLGQIGTIREDVEIPWLVIIFGALLLFAKIARVPLPEWMEEASKHQ